VVVDQKVRIDFHLQVGTELQTIDVSAQGALLSTEQATLGQVVNQQNVQELPLNGQSCAGNDGAAAVGDDSGNLAEESLCD
jgi:hypothetical protein